MTLYAGFQNTRAFPRTANPGDFYGIPEYNAGASALADPDGNGIKIGTFCWGILNTNNTQVSQFPGSNKPLAGFVARTQNTVWNDADITLGYSMTISPKNNFEYFTRGSFYASVPSKNVGGVILNGDIIIQNNTTGLLESQTSTTIPSGYTQIVGWTVINPSPLSTVTPAPDNATALAVISNIKTF